VFRRLFDEVYGGDGAEFPAPGSPQQAADLLARATPRTSLQTPFQNGVVGAVRAERVSLRYHRAGIRNSFAPFFRGQFSVESGQTVLRGAFGLHPIAKAFMTVWFGIAGCSGLAAVVIAVQGVVSGAGILSRLSVAVGALLFTALGFVFLRFAKWISRRDPEQIRLHTRGALRIAA
jgi:hypothetical protein